MTKEVTHGSKQRKQSEGEDFHNQMQDQSERDRVQDKETPRHACAQRARNLRIPCHRRTCKYLRCYHKAPKVRKHRVLFQNGIFDLPVFRKKPTVDNFFDQFLQKWVNLGNRFQSTNFNKIKPPGPREARETARNHIFYRRFF